MHLSDYYESADVGRCVCSASKSLRFGWKEEPLPHPSFFWGCSRYTPVSAFKHDKASPVSEAFWKVISDEVKIGHIADKNLKLLLEKTAIAITFWDSCGEDQSLLKHASSLC